jgi:hypothetical protein
MMAIGLAMCIVVWVIVACHDDPMSMPRSRDIALLSIFWIGVGLIGGSILTVIWRVMP